MQAGKRSARTFWCVPQKTANVSPFYYYYSKQVGFDYVKNGNEGDSYQTPNLLFEKYLNLFSLDTGYTSPISIRL